MKKLTSIFFAAILFVSAGCKKSFFEINENPNSPTDAAITPALILPSALNRAASKMATSYNNYAQWEGYWARSGTYGPSTEGESFNITSNYEADEWTWYDILYDFETMQKKAAATPGQGMYVAIAKIMKSIGFMYLVDQYNNVPYSQAFDLLKYPTPAYDKGDVIYADLLKQLNEAIVLLKAPGAAEATGIEDADVVYGGDVTHWLKLANTQKLKLLIHESAAITSATATTALSTVAADGGFIGAGTVYPEVQGDDAWVNLAYSESQNKQNPFWDSYEKLYTGEIANQFYRANNYLLVQTYRWNNPNGWDTRFLYVFDPAASKISTNTYYGYNYGEVLPNSDPYKAANSSDVSGPSLAHTASQPQWFFTSVESLFLQAEAIQRGWIPGNAQTAYNAAVTESFRWLGADLAEASDYLANDSFATWSASRNKIRLIAFQKWIALAGINNFEGYVDIRRLDGAEAILVDKGDGLPVLPQSLAPSRGSNHIPYRLIYPQNEYNYNAAVVAKEGKINPQTDKIFWDKGN